MAETISVTAAVMLSTADNTGNVGDVKVTYTLTGSDSGTFAVTGYWDDSGVWSLMTGLAGDAGTGVSGLSTTTHALYWQTPHEQNDGVATTNVKVELRAQLES